MSSISLLVLYSKWYVNIFYILIILFYFSLNEHIRQNHCESLRLSKITHCSFSLQSHSKEFQVINQQIYPTKKYVTLHYTFYQCNKIAKICLTEEFPQKNILIFALTPETYDSHSYNSPDCEKSHTTCPIFIFFHKLSWQLIACCGCRQ